MNVAIPIYVFFDRHLSIGISSDQTRNIYRHPFNEFTCNLDNLVCYRISQRWGKCTLCVPCIFFSEAGKNASCISISPYRRFYRVVLYPLTTPVMSLTECSPGTAGTAGGIRPRPPALYSLPISLFHSSPSFTSDSSLLDTVRQFMHWHCSLFFTPLLSLHCTPVRFP